MVVGSVLVALALGLFIHNEREQRQAGEAVNVLMPQVVEAIQERQESPAEGENAEVESVPEIIITDQTEKEMPVVEINGYGYIGFLAIPALQLELPVMTDWSYTQLKVAPCRFAGSTYGDDLVVMAHNYVQHFAKLHRLRVDDTVTFTDMDGVTTEYRVVALDVLAPSAVEEMTAGDYDLTLFTCTYSGNNRVTVRCDKIEE